MDFADNCELERMIKTANQSRSGSNLTNEFMDLLKDSCLIMPVLMSGVDDSGFEINYIKIGGDKQAVALLTSKETLDESGLRSDVIPIHMGDLAEMLSEMPGKYAVISINPVTDLSINIPTESFLDLFD